MKVRSRADVEKLKAEWREDSTWDLADTPGFEAHRDELGTFQEQVKAEAQEKREVAIAEGMRRFNCSRELFLHIEALERRVADNESRLHEIENNPRPPSP